MEEKHLYFVSGPSGVGKTSVLDWLKKILSDKFRIYDFDEGGVPDNADNQWRRGRTKHWEDAAQELRQDGLKTIVTGLCQPDEISDRAGVQFVLLDANDDAIRERLGKRFVDSENVESLRRVTGKSPEGFVQDNLNHAKKLRELNDEYGGIRIDTSDLSPEQVALRLKEELDLD